MLYEMCLLAVLSSKKVPFWGTDGATKLSKDIKFSSAFLAIWDVLTYFRTENQQNR